MGEDGGDGEEGESAAACEGLGRRTKSGGGI